MNVSGMSQGTALLYLVSGSGADATHPLTLAAGDK